MVCAQFPFATGRDGSATCQLQVCSMSIVSPYSYNDGLTADRLWMRYGLPVAINRQMRSLNALTADLTVCRHLSGISNMFDIFFRSSTDR